MNDAFENRKKALEEEYFRRQEQQLISKMKARLADENQIHYNCPKCSGKLIRGNFEDVRIDVCDTCGGVWLDAGELQQISTKDTASGWFTRLLS